MLFEDKVIKLKNSIKGKRCSTPCGFLTSDSVYQETSTALPLLTIAEKHVKKSLLLPASQMLHQFSEAIIVSS
jgi:hypothetical protein